MESLLYLLYDALLCVTMVLTLPYWVFQMVRHGKGRAGLWERLGRVPRRLQIPAGSETAIWVHAVSVGEVLAVAGLVEELKRRRPNLHVFVSTTTDTGQSLARKKFGEKNVFYFPMDFRFAVHPYFRALRPKMVVIAETEFWPNFLRLARLNGARVAVVNARISDRSRPSYYRWRWLLSRVLGKVDLFLGQTEEDAFRLREIGASAERVRVGGNLKYDLPPPTATAVVERVEESMAKSGGGRVLVCGSTMEGEESLLLKAFENVLVAHPQAVMVLAPRHPERFGEVAQLLAEMKIRFRSRSQWQGETLNGGVLLLDTIGELAAMYGVADVAFVGGSLVPRGGHNILEPAQFGVAIIVGNHTENFREMVGLFQSRDALRIVGPAELPLVLLELMNDREKRETLGWNAAQTMRSQAGAMARAADALEELLSRP